MSVDGNGKNEKSGGKLSRINPPKRTIFLPASTFETICSYPITKGAILFYIAIRSYANSEGWCNPSIKTFAEMLSCDPRSIKRHIQELCEYGLLSVEVNKGHSSNDYYLNLEPKRGDNFVTSVTAKRGDIFGQKTGREGTKRVKRGDIPGKANNINSNRTSSVRTIDDDELNPAGKTRNSNSIPNLDFLSKNKKELALKCWKIHRSKWGSAEEFSDTLRRISETESDETLHGALEDNSAHRNPQDSERLMAAVYRLRKIYPLNPSKKRFGECEKAKEEDIRRAEEEERKRFQKAREKVQRHRREGWTDDEIIRNDFSRWEKDEVLECAISKEAIEKHYAELEAWEEEKRKARAAAKRKDQEEKRILRLEKQKQEYAVFIEKLEGITEAKAAFQLRYRFNLDGKSITPQTTEDKKRLIEILERIGMRFDVNKSGCPVNWVVPQKG